METLEKKADPHLAEPQCIMEGDCSGNGQPPSKKTCQDHGEHQESFGEGPLGESSSHRASLRAKSKEMEMNI